MSDVSPVDGNVLQELTAWFLFDLNLSLHPLNYTNLNKRRMLKTYGRNLLIRLLRNPVPFKGGSHRFRIVRPIPIQFDLALVFLGIAPQKPCHREISFRVRYVQFHVFLVLIHLLGLKSFNWMSKVFMLCGEVGTNISGFSHSINRLASLYSSYLPAFIPTVVLLII